MGSEDSIPISETGSHSNLPAFTKRTPQNSSTRHDYELLIVIRGQRNTGKTSLVQRMQGLPFSNDYTPTKTLSAAEFIWSSPKSEKVRITLWDVVERALLPSDLDEKIEYPDATTVDTYKRADGLVIMIDTRYPDTIKLATQILRDAPDHIPIVVFSNFQDANDAVPTIPKPIKQYIERFSFIAGSMKSNLGLDDLNKWLSLPLAKSKSTLYLNKYKSLMESLNQKILDFTTTAEYYVDLETALSRMPKPTLIGNQKNSQNSQQQQQQQNQTQRRLSEMNIAKDDNDFWSDDDEDEINKQIQRKINSNKPQENPKGEELFVSNPMVKRRVIKKPQNASPPDQNKNDEIKDNENEQSQNKTSNIKHPTPNVQPQIKIDGGDVDDDFFNDDDEDEAKIPQNVNLKVLEEEDDEPLRPNPLVASSKSKVPAKPQVQVKKQNEETKTENEIKEPEKPIIPTIKVENEDNGFFDDNDDAENEEDAQSTELDKEDSDEEQLKPNPLVSAKPVPNTKPVIQNKVAANVAASSEAEKENKESQKQEEPAIPTIKVENEDNGFFDDDDNEDNEQDMKADELNKEDSDDEPLKPNPLVSSKPVPNTKPAPTVTANETQNEAKNEDKEPEKQVEPAIPTIEVENEDNGFFDDDENEQEVNDIDNNNDDNDEEQLKPNPLVSSKPVPNANQAIVATNEEEQKKEEEASIPQQQNLAEEPNAQVSLPTIDAGKVDDDFFNDDENENEKPQDATEKAASNESVNNEEKVDDGFFDDEDEANNDNDAQPAISNNDDEDEDEVIKPNPLVATNVKSKLQDSLAQQQEKELQEQQQQQEQRQELEQQHTPSIIPDIQQNEEVDDFFNDDDQEQNQNDEAANSNTDDYAEINEDSKPKVAKRKLVKKKRTKRQKQDDDADAAPPQVSGDYESI